MYRYLKKGLSFLVPIFSLFLALTAFAGGYAKPYFDGFYAGLGGGIVSSMAHITTDIKTVGLGAPPPVNNDFDLGKHGVNGNIFAGFGKTLDSAYYLGGEIFGNIFNPKMNAYYTGSKVNIDIRSPYSFGGDIRGGYIIYPRVMLYVLFGLDYAKFKINNDYVSSFSGIISENNFNRWRLGYTPGIGAQIGLCDYLSLRLQYDYTFYSSFSHSTVSSRTIGSYVYTTTIDTKVKPSRGLFTLKLSLKF